MLEQRVVWPRAQQQGAFSQALGPPIQFVRGHTPDLRHKQGQGNHIIGAR